MKFLQILTDDSDGNKKTILVDAVSRRTNETICLATMQEEDTADAYEENESDVETYACFPFIKVESDGSLYIDGQPSHQDASQMNIESAEVLVLPFGEVVTGFSSNSNSGDMEEGTTFHEVVGESIKIATPGTALVATEADEISETLLHDHNYDQINCITKLNLIGDAFVVEQDETVVETVQNTPANTTPGQNPCKYCEKSFNTAASLKRHVRIHTGERPFQCQVCEKYFSQQSNLWKHVRTHTGERPFECPNCKKRFSQRANMKKHLIIHTGERPFICGLCSRGFTQQANLSKHMRLHTGEKPYACLYCDKRFTQRSNLQKHEHLHEGIKPYTCDVCFQAFTQQSNLRKHEMMHNNIKKFVCDICNKGYVQKVSLIKHRQRCNEQYQVQYLDEDSEYLTGETETKEEVDTQPNDN